MALALEPRGQDVPELDLWGVSEFKVSGNGGVEVKFADRVKAVSLLLDRLNGGEDGPARVTPWIKAALPSSLPPMR